MNITLMEYNAFINYVKENIADYLEDVDVENICISQVTKNNGVALDALNIVRRGEEHYPIIYLNDYYQQYLETGSMEDLLEQLADVYLSHLTPAYAIPLDWQENFQSVRNQVVFRLINYDRNKEQLAQCPYIRVLDLALTYRILFNKDALGISTIMINQNMLERWRISEFDLYNLAVDNSRRLFPPKFEPMEDVLRTMINDVNGLNRLNPKGLEDELFLSIPEHMLPEGIDLFVLSNEQKLNGASALFYTDLVSDFSKSVERDIYILPSSIHEVLLVPENSLVDPKQLRDIVRDANQKVVMKDEVLSDNIYIYHRDTEDFEIYQNS